MRFRFLFLLLNIPWAAAAGDCDPLLLQAQTHLADTHTKAWSLSAGDVPDHFVVLGTSAKKSGEFLPFAERIFQLHGHQWTSQKSDGAAGYFQENGKTGIYHPGKHAITSGQVTSTAAHEATHGWHSSNRRNGKDSPFDIFASASLHSREPLTPNGSYYTHYMSFEEVATFGKDVARGASRYDVATVREIFQAAKTAMEEKGIKGEPKVGGLIGDITNALAMLCDVSRQASELADEALNALRKKRARISFFAKTTRAEVTVRLAHDRTVVVPLPTASDDESLKKYRNSLTLNRRARDHLLERATRKLEEASALSKTVYEAAMKALELKQRHTWEHVPLSETEYWSVIGQLRKPGSIVNGHTSE